MSNDDTPPYEPATPYYSTNPPATAKQTTKRGPLSARLAARALNAAASDTAAILAYDQAASDSGALESSVENNSTATYTPGSGALRDSVSPAPTFTALLREPDGVSPTPARYSQLGTRWDSRADMLGACHDEYFQLNTRYNDARELLGRLDRKLTPLRMQQATAQRAMRDLEAHIELHSRSELRSAYLGLADIELRVFRFEQERDLMAGRIEELENFMGFLSRVIATVREIPVEALEQPNFASAEPEASNDDEYTEVELDADEAAELVASARLDFVGDVEVGDVEVGDVEVGDDAAKGQPSSGPM